MPSKTRYIYAVSILRGNVIVDPKFGDLLVTNAYYDESGIVLEVKKRSTGKTGHRRLSIAERVRVRS